MKYTVHTVIYILNVVISGFLSIKLVYSFCLLPDHCVESNC